MTTILILEKRGIICEKIKLLYDYDEPEENSITIQDVTFENRDNRIRNDFLSDIWHHVINGKIPSLFSLCSAKVFQNHCLGDICTIQCGHCYLNLCQQCSWTNDNDWQEKSGNYYEIIWSMIKLSLKDIKVVTSRIFLPLSKQYRIDLNTFGEAFMDDDPVVQGFTQVFDFDLMHDQNLKVEKNIKELNLPKFIKKYLMIPLPCTFRYQKYCNQDNIPWLLKHYNLH